MMPVLSQLNPHPNTETPSTPANTLTTKIVRNTTDTTNINAVHIKFPNNTPIEHKKIIYSLIYTHK